MHEARVSDPLKVPRLFTQVNPMTQTNAWLTESIRFSLLGVPEGAKVSWQSIMGKDAESMTNRPAQQLVIEEGPCDNGRLVVTAQPGRIDITMTAMPTDPVNHPSLGSFEDVSSVFERRMASIKLPTAARLAFGAVLNTFPGDSDKSKKLFKTLVPQFSIDSEVDDIMLQFNRPKKLPKVSGIVLNRLTKWSQLALQTIQYQNNQALNAASTPLIQLELDFNSHQESKLPNSSAYGSLIAAMFSEARSVVSGEAHG
ncbi:hypothetical protein [Pseudomonas jessenii]|uniref:hypothetical protein n=1 Tax=Pseudomonas jessenii TaxID=77298 RepID=UPI0038920D0C